MISYYGRELMALKTNLHCHTTKSDGSLEPQELIDRYAAAGYDVLAVTDHRQTHDTSIYDCHGMLMLSGTEIHPLNKLPEREKWHVVCIDIPLDFKHTRPENEGLDIQRTIDAVNGAGALAFIAHPYWCGLSSADILPLSGYCGIEVCNTECFAHGRGYSMQTWDELLEAGLNVNAVAVDDTHLDWALGKSWTMVCTAERTVPAVIEALKNGSYYATQGPVFKRLSYENGIFSADFSPAVQVQIIAARRNHCGGQSAIFPGYENQPMQEIEHVEFDLNNLTDGNYFRFQIKDRNGNYAWSNPVRIKRPF